MVAEETLAALIAALNAADPAVLDGFLAARNAVAGAPPRWASFRRTAGPLVLVEVERSEPHAVTATLEDHWDRRFGIELSVAAEPPHRMVATNVTPVRRPEAALPARMPWPELKRALEAKIAAGVAEDRLSGAVIVSRHGETLHDAVYGYADRAAQQPNTLETRFRVGSMNKMFTGVAVLQLAQAGRVELDDAVVRHLPDYPNPAFAAQVSIRHLLNHTGGAGDFFGPQFREHRLQLRDPKDFVALLGDRAPEFEPGTQYRYANYGFILLGRIIEAASGRSYDDYVQAHVFDAAGMSRTGAQPEDAAVEGRAVGYMDSPAGLVRNDPTLPYRGTPAGGGYSTIGDLVRFAEALTAGKLLDPPSMQPMGAGGVEIEPGVSYGAGFQELQRTGVRSLGHSGGAPGMNGTLLISPDTGYVVAALANGDPPQASSLGDFIDLRLPAS
jgi:CubicO group peptidase (beta-lactamase class C family)